MKHRFLFHPVLLGLFPILFEYVHNAGQAQWRDAIPAFMASLILILGLWGILTPVVKDARRRALVTSLLLLSFLSFGHMLWMNAHLVVGTVFLGRTRYLLPVWLLATGLGTYWILRSRSEKAIDILSRTVNIFSVFLVVLSLLQIGYFEARQAAMNQGWEKPTLDSDFSSGEAQAILPADTSKAQASTLPDIYYIIPDSYEANSSLLKEFHYDNSAFTDGLQKKGFFVASKSTSNYAFTALSLASSLNMEMLNHLGDGKGRSSTDFAPLRQMMQDNKVMTFLKAQGYTLIDAGSWLGSTSAGRKADISMKADRLNEFTINWLKGTLLYPFTENFLENNYRNKTLSVFERLGEIPEIPGPTFTLAHLICPHPPYVFGPNGERVSATQRFKARTINARKQYLDQLIFMNKKIEIAVEEILARSSTPPIIIIQGDHGAAYTSTHPARINHLPDDDFCKEQMRILNAYYLPGKENAGLYDSISPVNSFRIVFNAYFGTNMPLLKNESFYSNIIMPYAFVDVTQKVKYEK